MRVIPVIHFLHARQALRNAELAAKHGCHGVFLIDMQGRQADAVRASALEIKRQLPELKLGINHLSLAPTAAVLLNDSIGLDMTWTDQCLTHTEANAVTRQRLDFMTRTLATLPHHEAYVGVAFKYQAPEPNPGKAAADAHAAGFIATTSGPATGQPIDLDKLREIRAALPAGASLAVASGVTPENVVQLRGLATHVLVATGINSITGDELIEESLLSELMAYAS